MPFARWHRQTIKKVSVKSDRNYYLRSMGFGLCWFVIFYAYLQWLGIPSAVNKAVADTSVVLIGSSMLLTAICYFWDFLDTKIIYRKYLGLVGFAFALLHIVLSWSVFKRVLQFAYWLGEPSPAVVVGTAATAIFLVMALISNKYAARQLGGKWWRLMLRTGYLGLVLVLLHVWFLKASRWWDWWQAGAVRPPASSLLVSIFMLVVLFSRLALEVSLRSKKSTRAQK